MLRLEIAPDNFIFYLFIYFYLFIIFLDNAATDGFSLEYS